MRKVRAPQIVGVVFVIFGLAMLVVSFAMQAGDEQRILALTAEESVFNIDPTLRIMHQLTTVRFAANSRTVLCVGSILLGAIMIRRGHSD